MRTTNDVRFVGRGAGGGFGIQLGGTLAGHTEPPPLLDFGHLAQIGHYYG